MKISFKQSFTYDAKGNKKTEVGFDGSANYRVVYNYLPNGKLSDITRFNADNSVAERWIYSYNGAKQQIRVTPKTGGTYTIEKTFDAKGNLLADTQISADGKEMRKLLGLSQAAFGEKYNISVRTIEQWESGRRQAPVYVLELLERAVIEDSKAEVN